MSATRAPAFRHKAPPKPVFEPLMLPESQREALCEKLLEEFGLDVKRRRGSELVHGCELPWSTHARQESEPTASLNFANLTYNCFGCATGGGLLWFIATMRRCNHEDARTWLMQQTGLGGEVMDLADLLAFFDALYDPRRGVKEPMPHYDPRILDPWRLLHPYMFDPPPEGRGVPESTLMHFQVGYDSSIERIVIPHYWRGDLVGWQSRRIWDDGSPKYWSTPQLPRDTSIYNYDPKRKLAVVVESPFTCLRHYHHTPEIEPTFGAAVTDEQVRLLAKHETVIVWMDNDKAGWDAVEGHFDEQGKLVSPGLGDRLGPYSNVLVVESNWAADGADMSDEMFLELKNNAIPYACWSRPQELRKLEAA